MIVINLGTFLTCNLTPKGLYIKVLMPHSPNPTVRQSQTLVKLMYVCLKISIEKSKFDVNRAVLITGILIYHPNITTHKSGK